jgi:hypothetical protein
MKKRFSEEQIIRILKEHEAGEKAPNRHFIVGKANTVGWKSVRQDT